MDVRRFTFNVLLEHPDGTTTEHEVVVRAGDRLKAELDANKFKLPEIKKAAQNHTAVWVWEAMTRTGDLPAGTDFFTFRDKLLADFERAEAGDEAVDPTPASSPSDSPSPATSETSATGSTPTSTTES